MPVAVRFGHIRLRDSVQAELLDDVVRNTIHSFNVERVNIYDLEGTITYSTEQDLIGTARPDLPAYKSALDGKISSMLITTPGEGLAGFQRDRALRTFAPFRAEKRTEGAVGYVLGVFEVYQDLSGDYAEITRFQYLSIAISLVFISVLFIVLRRILIRADTIIEQRNEERRRLEEKTASFPPAGHPGSDDRRSGPRDPQPVGHHQQHRRNFAEKNQAIRNRTINWPVLLSRNPGVLTVL